MSTDSIHRYVTLIEAFVLGTISAVEFERKYLDMFKDETESFLSQEFCVLDTLFGDVDAFCADAHLRDENDLDEVQLKQRSQQALRKLKGP